MGQTNLTIALTGGTGFVGRHLLPQLLAAGHRVRVLARDPVRIRGRVPSTDERIVPVAGDLFDPRVLAELVRGAEAVVHLVGIIMENPRRGQTFERVHVEATKELLAAAQAAGVKRWVHMSALGARPDAPSNYHRTKWLAEEAVRASGLAWTIFRPSVIHGPDGELMQMVKGFWTKRLPPVVPYFGGGLLGTRGAGRLQPVWVEDVARCFVAALARPESIGQVYPLGGPDTCTWPEFYRTVRDHLPKARKKPVMPVPAWLAKMLARLPGVPFNRDQVVMSQEDSVCDSGKAQRELGVTPSGFAAALAQYASQL
jgi:uncharacterized protein YbjT (DUF2867 family)